MIEVEFDLAYLPWFDGQSDPRTDPERRAEEPIECGVCSTKLEWRATKYAYCPSCRRSVRAGTGKNHNHIYAKNYRLFVRK